MQAHRATVAGFLVLAMIFSAGCSSKTPARQTAFTGGLLMWKHPRYPFDKVWLPPNVGENKARYDKVMFTPVTIEYLAQSEWVRSQPTSAQMSIANDARELARYFNEQLRKEFQKNGRLKYVDQPGPGTVYAELAIVDLRPSDAWLNAAGVAAGFVVPGSGAVASMVGEKGYIAIEGRFRDSQTGQLLAMMADKEQDKLRPVNLAGSAWYHNSREHLRTWAKQLVQLSNSEIDTDVRDRSPVTISPL